MTEALHIFFEQVNQTRYREQPEGHYESFFQRANHPTRPLAFWIRYTIFSPKAHPEAAVGELWGIFFNGETGQHTAVKQEYPIAQCSFSATSFHVQIGSAVLDAHQLLGTVHAHQDQISWNLSYSGNSQPLLLFPVDMYQKKFPAAKSLVGLPLACYSGELVVNGESIPVSDWVGSQNHNWGRKHTDRYAWGQVAGFDNFPESFLEVATARLKIGPFWSPPMTPLVLRHRGQEYALNSMARILRAQGRFDYFTWTFQSASPRVEIKGEISAASNAFVGLRYFNPPGGTKICLNTKIAACRLQVRDLSTGNVEVLETRDRAAFEILSDDASHGIAMRA